MIISIILKRDLTKAVNCLKKEVSMANFDAARIVLGDRKRGFLLSCNGYHFARNRTRVSTMYWHCTDNTFTQTFSPSVLCNPWTANTLSSSLWLTDCPPRYGSAYALFNEFYGCLSYADDILLKTHTFHAMQMMLRLCDKFVDDFDIWFSCGKSVAVRIGKRFNEKCVLLQLDRKDVSYVNELKYFRCSCDCRTAFEIFCRAS